MWFSFLMKLEFQFSSSLEKWEDLVTWGSHSPVVAVTQSWIACCLAGWPAPTRPRSIRGICRAPPGYEKSLSRLWDSEEGWEETCQPSLVPSLCVRREPVPRQLGGVASFFYILTEEPDSFFSAFSAWTSQCPRLGPKAWSWPPWPSGQMLRVLLLWFSSCGLLTTFPFPPLLALYHQD